MSKNSQFPDSLSRFVAHYSTRTESSPPKETPTDFIRFIDSDIGRSVDFNRIAVHHIVLPPGCRTSKPHAESLEEEFVFVLKGEPHLWLNGYIHDLREHYAVGFPAGTGIAHTFINNTNSDVHLLVAGDKTKNENLCSFPINPELKKESPIWWDNPPKQEIGPHNGLPGPIQETERAKEASQYIIDCKAQGRLKPFHYPGDNETFGEGFRLTKIIGLKNLGITYDFLPSGTRSAFPHAHTHEEEFVYVLQGKPTVWLDGCTKIIGPDDFAAYPSNTGLAHALINDSDEEVLYLCIGETFEFPNEKITYPLNPLRQKECRRKGWYWDDHKTPASGLQKAQSDKYKKEHLAFQVCNESDAETVLEVFNHSAKYFQQAEGLSPNLQMVKQLLADQPAQPSDDYFKECLIIQLNNKPIGFLEVHAHHPQKETCYLGLLLIREDLFSQGFGRKCYELAEDYILRALQCSKIHLGVSAESNTSGFWQKMGFEFSGKKYEKSREHKTSILHECIKDLKIKNV